MSGIPTIIVEEHHEAFVVWHEAVRCEWLKPTGNVLLHVDSHADLNDARLTTPLSRIPHDLAGVDQFALRELGIARFIVPALYQGRFRSFTWLYPRRTVSTPAAHGYLLVQQADSDGLNFVSRFSKQLPWGAIHHPNLKCVAATYCDLAVAGQELSAVAKAAATANLALDIDLDFFSCDAWPHVTPFRLEITRNQFERLRNDRYHPLLILADGQFTLAEIEDRHYLVSREASVTASPCRLTESQIEQRIDQFVTCLAALRLTPSLVTICRSRISGFTPADQWEFIEQQLLDRLQQLYPLHVELLTNRLASEYVVSCQ
jgi:hypothetical protein